MMNFEDVLEQYEPKITASTRKLSIYHDHDSFRQLGRFDESKGNFIPIAYRSIRGGVLDELKRQSQFEENIIQMEDEFLRFMNDMVAPVIAEWTDCLSDAL